MSNVRSSGHFDKVSENDAVRSKRESEMNMSAFDLSEQRNGGER